MPLPLLLVRSAFFNLHGLAQDLSDWVRHPEAYTKQDDIERVQYYLSVGCGLASELQRLLTEAQAGQYPETTGNIERLLTRVTSQVETLTVIRERLMAEFPENPVLRV